MNVEEKSFGVPLTPELRSLVRTVFERSFARVEAHAAEVHVRLFPARDGVECRAVLRPRAGGAVAITETRPSMLDAVLASANGLARELQRRYLSHSRKSRHRRTSRRRRARLAA